MSFRKASVLPGFGLTFGFTTFFLSAIVLLPLAALVLSAAAMHWSDFLRVVSSPRALGSTSSNRSLATSCEYFTRNTDPMISPSRSAIQQRSRFGSKFWMNFAAISATSASKVSS